MAQNQGGDGKGQSKFRSSEQEREDRHRARAAKKRNRAGKGKDTPLFGDAGTETLVPDGLGQIGAQRAARIRAIETQRQAAIEAAYADASNRLTDYGRTKVPRKGDEADLRQRWADATIEMTCELLRLYFYGFPIDIEAQEKQLTAKLVEEARRRFTAACYFNDNLEGLPGQELAWFEEVYQATADFHQRQRAKKATERRLADQATQTSVEAGKVLVSA